MGLSIKKTRKTCLAFLLVST